MHVEAHAWSPPTAEIHERGFLRVAERASARAPSPLAPFIELLAHKVYRPVFRAHVEDKWRVLEQGALGDFFHIVSTAALCLPDGSADDAGTPVRELRFHPAVPPNVRADLQEAASLGWRNIERVRRLWDRNEHRHAQLLKFDETRKAFAARLAFSWAAVGFLLSSDDECPLFPYVDDDSLKFMGGVLFLAARDLYVLMRAAQLKLDALESVTSDEGSSPAEMSPEDRTMERDAHSAWLQTESRIASRG